MAKPKKSAEKAETKKQKEQAAKAEVKKTGTHEAVQEFRDYAESTDGTGYALYKKGDDVSHLPESKLKTFMDANLVKRSAAKEE